MEEAQAQVHELGDKALEVKFEDLLRGPYEILKSLMEFCGLKPSEEVLAKAAKQARPDRAYAYCNDPELRDFAQDMSKRLKVYGYSA